jgi:hypothetical protein
MSDMTQEAMLKRIAELEAQLSKKATGGIKIALKGGVSVYNLGRYPVTLYASQWRALFGRVDEIKAFLEANKGKYAEKE